MIYVREALPHANDTTSIYVYGVNWQLLAFILVLLIVSATERDGPSFSLTFMSILLMLSNICSVPLAFTNRVKDRERESVLRRQGSMRESELSQPSMGLSNGKNVRGSACKHPIGPEKREAILQSNLAGHVLTCVSPSPSLPPPPSTDSGAKSSSQSKTQFADSGEPSNSNEKPDPKPSTQKVHRPAFKKQATLHPLFSGYVHTRAARPRHATSALCACAGRLCLLRYVVVTLASQQGSPQFAFESL